VPLAKGEEGAFGGVPELNNMARYNNKKLQIQRNFQSIWHCQPEYISTLLKEDQLIREYIIGTMKAKG
jgi:hypothetical protein